VPPIVRLWRRWHAPITRAVAGIVDVRRTENSSRRGIRRAALAFADDTIRDYELLPTAAGAVTPGTVGVACFRQDHVMAFLPLDGAWRMPIRAGRQRCLKSTLRMVHERHDHFPQECVDRRVPLARKGLELPPHRGR